ncbi:hypothetical protein [Sphingomonas crocodyli]|uniref:Uncharacterized protein n=1 Tax=Sphingomonas crocodyli TaxID=1979270 RepID=A0A437M7H5_9SPHN|nr:hypothetical protein [Sphingomonas crocodyli]RVT93444.1 hypothetical protein EOD43_06095 [Sphingomonas crocodyli]
MIDGMTVSLMIGRRRRIAAVRRGDAGPDREIVGPGPGRGRASVEGGKTPGRAAHLADQRIEEILDRFDIIDAAFGPGEQELGLVEGSQRFALREIEVREFMRFEERATPRAFEDRQREPRQRIINDDLAPFADRRPDVPRDGR